MILGPVYRGITGGMEALGFERRVPLGPESRGPFDLMLHGASAGEVRAGDCWLESVLNARPHLRVLRTTGTRTGLEAGADIKLPMDLPRATAQFLDQAAPKALILTEGELWPNLLREASRRSIPIGVVGARLSPRAERGWALAGRSGRSVLRLVTAWATASPDARSGLLRLGVEPARIAHCGWLKWPQLPSLSLGVERTEKDRPTLVLGNVYPGETRMLMDQLKGGPLDPSNAHWTLVLRHNKAEGTVRREAATLLPQGSWGVEARFGTLDRLYASADAIFVGGGGKGRGVHDLLAPLAHGHPPLCFLQRGDPGAVGRTLAPFGLVWPLDEPARTEAPVSGSGTPWAAVDAALRPPPWAWSKLVGEYDGRTSATAWFEQQGVL